MSPKVLTRNVPKFVIGHRTVEGFGVSSEEGEPDEPGSE
jgi:hypothetical protein